MKTLKKIKLTQLSKAEMDERQMNAIGGGNNGGGCDCTNCGEGSCPCDQLHDHWIGNLGDAYEFSRNYDTSTAGWVDSSGNGVQNFYSNGGGFNCSY